MHSTAVSSPSAPDTRIIGFPAHSLVKFLSGLGDVGDNLKSGLPQGMQDKFDVRRFILHYQHLQLSARLAGGISGMSARTTGRQETLVTVKSLLSFCWRTWWARLPAKCLRD